MRLRLVSDLHIDVNRDYGVSLVDDGPNDVFTLVAGDVCGTVDDTVDWMRKNVERGAFCAGNHIVYDPKAVSHGRDNRVVVPIEDIKARLHEEFPPESDITFMDNDVGVVQKEIGDGVLLVADVMYTDYRLPIPGSNPKGDQVRNMRLCTPRRDGPYLNDFNFGFTREKMYEKEKWDDGTSAYGTPDGIWRLRPKYYLDHHERAWKEVTRIVEENPGRDVVLMTHHCLSKRCISDEYVSDSLNASYVSDKDDWIAAHPNVRLILSGHVHHRAHFDIGKTLYVLNPLGYCRDTAVVVDPVTLKDSMWTPHCFVDTETWTLSYEPYDNRRWREMVEAYNTRYSKYYSAFF